MKKLAVILMILLAAVADAAHPLVEKAEKAYDQKKYREAISHYEALLDEGFTSFELYYNLGNAYFRDNQLGMAIYNYERARKLEPNDEDVRINLSIASARTIDKIDSRENFFISAVRSNVLSSFSTKTWAWITIISITLCCALFFVYLISGKLVVKRIGFLAAGLFLLIFIFTYILGYSAMRAKYDNRFAIILAREAKVMNEPTPSATSKFGLHEGTKVHVVRRNGDWLLIRLDNGNEGWLRLGEVGII